MAREVPIGTRAEVEQTVAFENTLSAVAAQMPPVLSTPWMIGWMEMACYMAQLPYCEPGEQTVGTRIDVVHRAPCTIGAKVISTAELERVNGRFFVFKVEARLEDGTKIGWGHVDRAVVHVERFMTKA